MALPGTASTQPPPTFTAQVNSIQISAEDESKVTAVTLYTGRAEVTREIRVSVKTGQNKVTILRLSSSLDAATLRVEGRGAGTIQGVSVTNTPHPPKITTSPTIETILQKQGEIEASIERCKRNRDAVYKYLQTLDARHVDAEKLGGIIQASEENLERLDKKMAGFNREINVLKTKLEEEKTRLNPEINTLLRQQAEVGVFADRDADVVLVLKYAVLGATWQATYDARVITQAKENSFKLIYQAKIRQWTGEDWTDVPILLETNAPTFNVDLPVLPIHKLRVVEKSKKKKGRSRSRSPARRGVFRSMRRDESRTRSRSRSTEESDEDMGGGLFDGDEPAMAEMATTVAAVQNKGAVSTTYEVPGLVTIPSDNENHSITIVELDLDAAISWIAVPKQDPRAHIQAKIANSSEYILLSGEVNIYVDGAFNSRSTLPLTNPQETFDFSLGIDSAIRITYHPRIEKASQSGLITKTSVKSSTQRITVQNTKQTLVSKLKIIDGIPISEDARITVKLKNPDLPLPSLANTIQRTLSITSGNGSIKGRSRDNASVNKDKKIKTLPSPVKVSANPVVFAQWHGVDKEHVDIDALGQEGKLEWVVTDIGSMESVNISLVWETSASEGLEYNTLRFKDAIRTQTETDHGGFQSVDNDGLDVEIDHDALAQLNSLLQWIESKINSTTKVYPRTWVDAFLYRVSAMLPPDKRMVLNVDYAVSPVTVPTTSGTATVLVGNMDYTVVISTPKMAEYFLYNPILNNPRMTDLVSYIDSVLGLFAIEAKSEAVKLRNCLPRALASDGKGASYSFSARSYSAAPQDAGGDMVISDTMPDMIGGILATWIQHSFKDIEQDDWFEVASLDR
ncbi:hypothetical protein NP233_g8558 [Leucocoprinus birnbaumii]|uniref:Mucoidy inhibitor A n=1 Tax=Leucocoprinus birnbaumii TaxID=56174 RepID=A0AAD5VM74_9AGAR|nr:hypothetical protein NP233_g8558 [Leucocoprinus birnbaumii]